MNAPDLARVASPLENPSPAPLTLGDIVEIIRRHRTLAAMAAVAAMMVVMLYAITRTPLYEAQTTVALDRSRSPAPFDPAAQVDLRLGLYEHDLLNTQRNILLSRGLLSEVVKALGPRFRDALPAGSDPVEALKDRLNVSTSRDSWDLSVTLRDEDPRRAEAGLQALLDAYQARHLGAEKDRADNAIAFLDDQVAEARRKMEQDRDREQAFQREKDLLILDPEHSFHAQRLSALNAKRVVLQQQLTSLETLVRQINAIDAVVDTDKRLDAMLGIELVNRHPTVVEQQKLLFELKTQEALLSQKYLDKHPRLIELRSEIAIKRQHLGEAVTSVRSGVLADYAKLSAQLPTLEASIHESESALNTYRESLFHLQTMTQQTKADEELYNQLLKRQGEERITRHLDTQQLMISDPPHAGSRPANINLSLSLALALVVGFVALVAAPLVREFLGRRVHGPSEVRQLAGVPVLAELPFVADLEPLGARGNPDQHAKLAESFRALRTALDLGKRGANGGRCVLVMSCDQHEGKSTVATRLAVSIALSGLKVLLVDGDLRQPSLRDQLGQECDRGLSQLLNGDAGVSPAVSTYPNLDFLDAGEATSNPGELLNSHCLPEWLGQCRQQYDYILIDTPPLRWFADALMIGAHADGMLLVVREGSTLKSSLTKSRSQLAPIADKLDGVVLIARADALSTLGFYGRYNDHGTQRMMPAPPAPSGTTTSTPN